MLEQIKAEALAQLAAEGAPALSLRQIARELGLVSSGLYRYFASRDELLTALIVDAYADLAQAVEVADTGLEPHEYRRRWLLRCLALRAWARSEPARYLLIYGSPVPGYQAPADTIAPAGAVILALLRVLAEAGAAGVLAERSSPDDPVLVDQLLAMGEVLALDLSVGTLARAMGALGEVFGLLALELGGHLVGGFEPADNLFGHSLDELADRIGLPASTVAR
jgi:AcrR family transcriptional regulator